MVSVVKSFFLDSIKKINSSLCALRSFSSSGSSAVASCRCDLLQRLKSEPPCVSGGAAVFQAAPVLRPAGGGPLLPQLRAHGSHRARQPLWGLPEGHHTSPQQQPAGVSSAGTRDCWKTEEAVVTFQTGEQDRTGSDGSTLMCTFLSVFLYLFRASSRFYDWICKENWQLGGLCCKEKCWMLGKCAHLLSRVWFGFTVYSEQEAESRQL